jgi:hypothetical protein
MALRKTPTVSIPPPTTTNEITKPAMTSGKDDCHPPAAVAFWRLIPNDVLPLLVASVRCAARAQALSGNRERAWAV